jgi:heme A synthase
MEKLLFWLSILALGVILGFLRTRNSKEEKDRTSKGRSGIITAMLILAIMIGGLVVSSYLRNETMTFVFGIGLMLVIPLMVVFAIGNAIGAGGAASRKDNKSEHPDR